MAQQIKLLDIMFYTAAAQQHGEDSEPDHEVGDLQDMLRAMWSILTPAQRVAYASSDAVQQTLESALPDFHAEMPALLGSLPKLTNEAMDRGWVVPLNLFTSALKKRITNGGPTLVELRDGTLEKIVHREANPTLDEDEAFENETGTRRWRLNGASIHSADLDMVSMT